MGTPNPGDKTLCQDMIVVGIDPRVVLSGLFGVLFLVSTETLMMVEERLSMLANPLSVAPPLYILAHLSPCVAFLRDKISSKYLHNYRIIPVIRQFHRTPLQRPAFVPCCV
jgi:hypothetical protein